jgi:hypothetical protein
MHTDDSDGTFNGKCSLSVIVCRGNHLSHPIFFFFKQLLNAPKVTLNVCLGDNNFTGATLAFCGMVGKPDHRQYQHTYHHKVGRAVLHLGDRRHGAEAIESGTRMNWIVWNQNWKYRSKPHYKRRMTASAYEQEQNEPSKVCSSYTHDRDYLHFYDELSEAARRLHLHP